MMIPRLANLRGHGNHGWLDSRHTFSFADYHDPAHMGFRSLRVINEDRVAPGGGFGMHGHRDMEIISVVLDGQLEHRDSLGHGAVLQPGEVQRISAGTGVRHSEFNPSPDKAVHFYQIWLLPDRPGHEPRYGQQAFAAEDRQNRWQTIASADGRDCSLSIYQDAVVALADVSAGAELTRDIAPGRHLWLQLLRGSVNVGGFTLRAGDGLALSSEKELRVAALEASELLAFDLA